MPIEEKITQENAISIFNSYDIIVDGSDNFETRYLVNDAVVLLEKILVYGAIAQFEGQVAVFNSNIHYRDLFPHPPIPGSVLNCAEAGVLGVLPGIIGSMMANEVIKIITGTGKILFGQLLTWNSQHNRFYTVSVQPNKKLSDKRPLDEKAFALFDYAYFCGLNKAGMIDAASLKDRMLKEKIHIIDIREEGELPSSASVASLHIPLSVLQEGDIPRDGKTVVFICQSGKRSAALLSRFSNDLAGSGKLYSLQGGLMAWLKENDHE